MDLFTILLLIVGVPLFLILIIIFMIRTIININKKGKEFKESLSKNSTPLFIQKKIEKKFNNFQPPQIDISTLVKTIGIYKQTFYINNSVGKVEETRFMYPILSWSNTFNFKNPLLKSYNYIRISGFNFSDPNIFNQYVYTKIYQGNLESFFINQNITVKFNEKILGKIDLKNEIIYDENDIEISKIKFPGFYKVTSIQGIKSDYKIPVYKENNLITNINVQPSTFQKFKQFKDAISSNESMDIPLFEDLNTNDDKMIKILIGLGLAMHYMITGIERANKPLRKY